MILWELDVDFEVLLGPNGPNAVDGRVVCEAVINAILTDVRGSDEVLESARFKSAFANVRQISQRIRNERVHSFEAGIGNRLVGRKTKP